MRFFLLLCISFSALNLKVQAQASPRLETLKKNYEAALEQARKPITQQYVQDLKKLKADLSREGNHREALLVDHLLRELGELEHNLESFLLSRTWKYTASFKKASTVVFKKDRSAEFTGTANAVYQWEILNDNTLRIHLPKDNHCDFVFPNLENQKITGRTDSTGTKRYLEPL